MRLLLCLSITVLLSASTFAQDNLSNNSSGRGGPLQSEQFREGVDRLFNSALVSDRAWAAYYVGKYGLKEYAPLIIELIQQSSSDLREENHLGCRVFFDSLIQLDVAVSADQLIPLYKSFPDEVMILLAKSPKDNQDALLSIAKRANPQQDYREHWLAACNLLAETEAKGFAAELLGEMAIELSVTVVEPNFGIGMGRGVGSDIGCGFGGTRIPNDFPPIAAYCLVDQASNGRVVVAPGLRTIYYQRTVAEAGKNSLMASGRSHVSWNKNRYVLEYLATLLKTTTGGLGFTNVPSRVLTWKSRVEYRQALQMYRKEIERGYDELKSRLLERDLLSPTASESLTPKITVRVFDYRLNKTVKLPEI